MTASRAAAEDPSTSLLSTFLASKRHLPAPEDREEAVLAKFLLQLSLIHADVYYGYPHVVLAASALLLALTTTGASSAAHAAVIEDLKVHFPEAVIGGSLIECSFALHRVWVRSFGYQCLPRSVTLKFGRASYHQVSSLKPPAWQKFALALPLGIHLFGAVSIVQQSLKEGVLDEDEQRICWRDDLDNKSISSLDEEETTFYSDSEEDRRKRRGKHKKPLLLPPRRLKPGAGSHASAAMQLAELP